jgi:hypothetical protein
VIYLFKRSDTHACQMLRCVYSLLTSRRCTCQRIR